MNVLITLTFFVVFCDKFATFTDFYIILFFSKKSSVLRKKLNVLRSPTISVAFYDKLASFTDFSDFHFFQKLRHLFKKKRTFGEILNFQSHSATILLSLAIFKNSCFFWKNSSNFFLKKSNFEHFENFYYFCRILRQNCYFYRFFKIFIFFKNSVTFLRKNERPEKSWNFSRFLQQFCYP